MKLYFLWSIGYLALLMDASRLVPKKLKKQNFIEKIQGVAGTVVTWPTKHEQFHLF